MVTLSPPTSRVVVRNERTGALLGDRIETARTLPRRLWGLIGRRSLAEGEGLLIEPCQGIHTVGMRIPIDVVFLDGAGCVLRVAQGVPPRRAVPWVTGAQAVLELPAGAIEASGTRAGDAVAIEPAESAEQA